MPNMTGRPGYRTMEMNGGSSGPCLACAPCVPLLCTSFNRGGSRRAFRLPGAGGDRFHCTVEPSPGHTRCRNLHNNKETVPRKKQSKTTEEGGDEQDARNEDGINGEMRDRHSLIMTRIAATSKSQIASDCNRNSKKYSCD